MAIRELVSMEKLENYPMVRLFRSVMPAGYELIDNMAVDFSISLIDPAKIRCPGPS